MKKRELLERIRELEARVAYLESRPPQFIPMYPSNPIPQLPSYPQMPWATFGNDLRRYGYPPGTIMCTTMAGNGGWRIA